MALALAEGMEEDRVAVMSAAMRSPSESMAADI